MASTRYVTNDHGASMPAVRGYGHPRAGATPDDGTGQVIRIERECTIEITCQRTVVNAARAIIRRIHPAEESLMRQIPRVNPWLTGRTGGPMEPQTDHHLTDLPNGLGKPALRALHAAGITQLAQLTAHTEAEVRQLHGMGPKAVGLLRAARAARGLAFAGAAGGPPS